MNIQNANYKYDTFTLKRLIDRYKNTTQTRNLSDICTKFSS